MKKITLIISLLIYNTVFSQVSKSNNSYTNYFKQGREIPFLHLNKTSFIKGEEIWFKAYMLNHGTQKLHQESTNLHVSIFNENGKLHTKKLLLLKKGIGSGNIKIDSTFKNTTYYIKASTNWMRNFTEDESYLQKIKIISNKIENIITEDTKIDFQILPEGGHLLQNTINSIGIIIKDQNNKGIQIDHGEILNRNKTVINTFKTNDFGIGKSVFFIKDNQNYFTRITLKDGTKITKEIKGIKEKGVIMSVNEQTDRFIKFSFKTNIKTLPNLENKKYYFLVHNTKVFKKEAITFSKNKKKYTFTIKNNTIPYGTNILTLFNENGTPISERIFFNYDDSLFTKINIKKSTTKDSISLDLFKNKEKVTNHFLSASLMPFETKSYLPSNSIYSKFLIKPYINGNIENSSYYFNNTNRKKLFELDLLLLTQGWSKYNWNNIFNSPPLDFYSFEKGISIKGNINTNYTKNLTNIVLTSKAHKPFLISDVKKNKFNFKNLFLREKDTILLSVLNKEKLEKAKIYLQFHPLENKAALKTKKTNSIFIKNTPKENINLKDFFIKEDELLNEVTVKGKKTFKNKPIGSINIGLLKKVKVDELPFQNRSILNYITSRGFLVRDENTQSSASIENQEIGDTHLVSRREHYRVKIPITAKSRPAQVFLDDASITSNIFLLQYKLLSDFEEIFISKVNTGVVYLYTKKNHKKNKEKLYSSYYSPIGFMAKKEYYQPKYNFTNDNVFNKYGAIHWEPNIVIHKESDKTSLKFPYLNQKKVLLFIEGITSNGQLISQKEIIEIN